MKKRSGFLCPATVLFTVGLFIITSFSGREQRTGYLLENEKDVAMVQPGPHNGGGNSTAYSFFAKAAGSKLVFRKRILHPGSAIGYHLQKEEEIYYIVSGTGEMQMNGQAFAVQTGMPYLRCQVAPMG